MEGMVAGRCSLLPGAPSTTIVFRMWRAFPEHRLQFSLLVEHPRALPQLGARGLTAQNSHPSQTCHQESQLLSPFSFSGTTAAAWTSVNGDRF